MADPAVMKRQMVMAEAVTNQKVPSASSYAKAEAAAQQKAKANTGQVPSPPHAKAAYQPVAKPAPVAKYTPPRTSMKMATPAAQKKAAGVQSAKAFTPARRRTTTAKKR